MTRRVDDALVEKEQLLYLLADLKALESMIKLGTAEGISGWALLSTLLKLFVGKNERAPMLFPCFEDISSSSGIMEGVKACTYESFARLQTSIKFGS